MPTQVQLRRGNTSDTLIFTGAAGEVTVDTDKKTIVVHDGTTSGGHNLSTEANTGAGNITVTNAYQANVGAARIADVASGQANTGAGNITVTNAYQANVGVAIASGQANTGAGLITVTNAYQANTGAVQIAKLDKAGGTITGNLTVSGITTLGNGAIFGSPSSVGTMPAFTLGGTIAGGGNQINNVIIGTTTPLAGSFTTLSASGTSNLVATNIIGTATIGGNSATPTLYLGGPAPDADRGADIYFQSSSVQKNWRVSHDGYVADSLEFTPSTVGGGSTYTTPAVVMSPTGLAVTGTLSATNTITAIGSIFKANGAPS